jgi:hypothetical protein
VNKSIGLLLGLSWIHPLLGASIVLIISRGRSISSIDFIFIILLLGSTLAAVTVTGSMIMLIPSMFMLLYTLLTPATICKSSLVKLLVIFCFFGLLYGFALFLVNGNRVGIWGQEPNFSGFSLIMLLVLALSRKQYVVITILMLFALILITMSRTLLLSVFVVMFMYRFKEQKFLIYMSIATIFSLFTYKPYLLSEYLNFFSSSGYINGVERLANINDSSALLRIELERSWVSIWLLNMQSIVFGVTPNEYTQLVQFDPGKIVHNSIIQKAVRDGILIISLILIFLFRTIPLWVIPIFLLYSVFLHSILSVFWIITMSFLLNQSPINNCKR